MPLKSQVNHKSNKAPARGKLTALEELPQLWLVLCSASSRPWPRWCRGHRCFLIPLESYPRYESPNSWHVTWSHPTVCPVLLYSLSCSPWTPAETEPCSLTPMRAQHSHSRSLSHEDPLLSTSTCQLSLWELHVSSGQRLCLVLLHCPTSSTQPGI